MNKLSVMLITYNEQDNIRTCLDSVSWVDEIVVLDQSSTDNTVAICLEYTDKVFSSVNKRYPDDDRPEIIDRTSNDWILYIDADERISTSLKDRIIEILSRADAKYDGYYIKRNNYIFSKLLKFGGHQSDYQLRLFLKDKVSFLTGKIHSQGVLSGPAGYIEESIEHYSIPTITAYLKKLDNYTTIESEIMAKNKEGLLKLKMLAYPGITFIYKYVFLLGVMDGWEGFIYCVFSSFYEFVKYAKCVRLNARGKYENSRMA